MSRTSFIRTLAGVVLTTLLSVTLAGSALADHETIGIDGDLTDLIAAVNANLGSSNGGFKAADPEQTDVCTFACCYTNGFDARNYYLFLDFKEPGGAITNNVKLYAGWDVTGSIGDTDGNGDPNTFNPILHPGCAISDPSATGKIGAGESYTIEIDMDCDGAADISLSVTGEAGQTKVIRTLPGPAVDISGQSQFAIANGFLELRIDNFRQLVEDAIPGADICHARVTMTANSQNDGLGEDRSSVFSLDVPHSVKISKLPAELTACPNGPLSWTIQVTNDGLCKLETLAVNDVMDTGLVFDSSVPASTGDATNRHWDFTNMASGASQSITLNAHTDPVWVAPILNNNVSVTGTHTPAPQCGDPEDVNTSAQAVVNSQQNVAATELVSLTRCPGAEAIFCTTASGTGPFTYAWTKDGSPLSETGSCLTIASPVAGDAGEYCVTVTGTCGTPVTRCATLTVSTNVGATVLTDLTRCPGAPAQFCTTASGTGPFTFEWTKDGSPLSETTNCLTIASPVAGDAGVYCVKVTGACGTPVTRCATLTMSTNVAATVLTDLTRCPGAEAIFCTTASGTGPFTYEWTKDGSPLSETTNCLTIASPVAGDAGEYCVKVTGACGTPVTRCATLTVSTNVAATVLTDLTRCPGAEAMFCTTASGTGPFTYEWTKDGSPLSATTNCLTILSPTAGDAGEYCVKVTGACGTPVTRCATLTVSTNVAATVLSDLTRCPGAEAIFCTTASGTGPFTYEWTKDGSPLSETTNCLTIASPVAGDAGEYCVKVTGACGTPVTRCATLTVSTAVAATVLSDLTRCPGAEAIFCTTASGTGPFTYEWTKDGSPLSETTNCLTIASPVAGDAGEYCVKVTGACGTPVTRCATLTVSTNVAATVISDLTRCPGAEAIFCTTASGTGPFTYEWTKDGSPLSETSNCLTIASPVAGDAGLYCVKVTGACGTPATRCATLTVSTVVAATTLSDLTRCPGAQAQFCTTASGTGPFTYAWTKDGSPLSETSHCLTITSPVAGDAGEYCVTVTGACGTPVTRCATLTVTQPVAATTITNLTLCPGTLAQFCTAASGTGPFTFAWTRNGSPLSETTNCLTIASPVAGDAGEYCVRVTGACGTPVTRCATLTVTPNVAATALSDITQCPGTQVQFCTTASGTGPFTYAWTKNGLPLSETSNCLTIASLAAGDAGVYCVTVSGGCGPPVQRCATLSADCPQQVCWLTAGGAKIDIPGSKGQPLHSWGGNVYPGCSSTSGDGGNWNHIAHALDLHFQGTHIEVVECGNVAGIPPGSSSPETPNNFIEFKGTGRLFGTGRNPANYPLVYFFARCEDRAEPGSKGQRDPLFKDRYYLHVYLNPADPAGSTLLLVNQTTDPTNVQPIPITDGNMQIHFTGCEQVARTLARPLNMDPAVDPSAEETLPSGVPSPNPFRETTRIAYGVVGQAASVEVAIYDISGRRVRSLVTDRREPGQYSVTWDGRDDQGSSVAHGMYFVRTMVRGQAQITKRVLFLN